MVRSLSLLLICLLFACSPQEPRTAADQGQDTRPAKPAQNDPESQQEALKITTWNLHWFPGHKAGDVPQADKEEHIQSVIKVLKQLDPDILTVQEVQNAEALETVAKETGFTLHVISDFEYDQELAILAKAQAVSAFQENSWKPPSILPGDSFMPPSRGVRMPCSSSMGPPPS